MTDYEETEDYELPYEEPLDDGPAGEQPEPFYDEEADEPGELSDEEMAYLAQAWLDSQEQERYAEGLPPAGYAPQPPMDTESAVVTRLQLADQAERQIRSEFPGLPEDDVARIRNAFFDTRYSAQDLAASFQGQTHLAYAALAYQEASRSGRLRSSSSDLPGRSPIAGLDMNSGISAEDRPTYEKWVQAFGKAYMVDGKIDHKLARRRFREATGG